MNSGGGVQAGVIGGQLENRLIVGRAVADIYGQLYAPFAHRAEYLVERAVKVLVAKVTVCIKQHMLYLAIRLAVRGGLVRL